MSPKITSKKQPPDSQDPEDQGECGATHGDCPNSWKGSCDRSAGHDGSHHCGSCNSSF
ncbi:MAG TPA: hypothetical protein VF017_05295 [Thermoanaerobaculia bacterium]|nr:hypothetical protein [Thermoanaerobaculia bacterium]